MKPNSLINKFLVFLACLFIASSFAQAADERFSEASRKNMELQIRSLNQEKQNRTPAQKKMESRLVHAAKEKRKEAIAPEALKFKSDAQVDPAGFILVDIRATVSPQLLKIIEKKGGRIINSFAEYEAIRASVPVDALEFLAGLPEVIFIKEATEPETHAISQGDRTHRADFVRANKNVFGTSTKITGQGIKIGLLSDSVDYLSNAQASNTKGRGTDLGPVTIITSAAGVQQHGRPATGEGTAMLEIVNDLAPGAQLFFATGNGGKPNMANNINRLRNVYGCDIIIDDLTYADESPFQDDVLGQAVNSVSDSGALYFSSAANSGNQNDGTSATWEGDFDGGAFIPGVGTYHRWSGTNIFNRLTVGGTNSMRIQIFWPDKLGQSQNDYDLYVFDNAGNILASSTGTQNGSQDPYEAINGVTNGLNIAVVLVNGAGLYLHLDGGRGRLQYGTSGDTRGHNASVAGNAFCVAASPIANSPAPGFFTGGTNNPVELFSSDGLRLRFYDRYTNAFTPGNFSSTGGFAFRKPDITAADGVANSGVYPASVGLNPFFGTSAAAPHAGAIAALLKCYNTNLTDVDIRQCLLLTALDIEAPGDDRDSGFGLIMADRALAMAQPTILRSVTNLSFSAAQGTNPPSQTFTIKNIGFTKLNWTVSSSETWLGVTPTSGDATKGIDTDVVIVSADISSLSVGVHTATITISDPEASNNGQIISVFVTVSDTTSPTVRITSPLNNSSHQNVPVLAGVASDGGGSGIQNNRVEFTFFQNGDFWTGTHWKSNTDAQDPEVLLFASIVNGTWSYTTIPTGPDSRTGDYFISAFVRDISGNLSPPEPGVTSISFKVDRNPPNLAITSPLDHLVITNAPFPGLSGTASDSVGLIGVNVYLYRFSDGQFWDGTAWGGGGSAILPVSISPGGNWNNSGALPVLGGSNPNTAFSNGDYNLIAIAFDGAGNERRADSIFTIDFHPVYLWTAGSFSDADPNNNNNRWDNSANWNPYGVPIPAATAVINGGDPDNRGIGIVDIYGVKLTGGTLNTTNMVIQKFTFSGGQITDGLIAIPTNGTFTISSANDKSFSGTIIDNHGTTLCDGTGNLFGRYGSAFNNYGVFRAEADCQFYNNSGGSPSPAFNNYGTFQKAVTTNSTLFNSANGGWIFNQFGTVDIQTGMLNLQSPANFQNGGVFKGAGSTIIFGDTATLFGTNTLDGGNVEFANGNFEGTGVFNGNGTFHWSGGTMVGSPTIAAGANLSIKGGDKTLFGTITNAGAATWTGSGLIYCRYNSAFYNSGTFTALNDSQFYNNFGSSPKPVFVNTGTFTKSAGTNTTIFNHSNGGVDFANHGNVDVQSGVLALGGGGSSGNGTFHTEAGTRVDIYSNSHEWNEGMNISGSGITRVVGAGLTLTNCTINVSPEATFELTSGTIGGSGTATGAGTAVWSGGNLAAVFNVESNLTMNISGTADKFFESGTLNNAGIIHWTETGLIQARYGSVINNTGLFEIQNDSSFYNYTGANPIPQFNNFGTIRKTSAAGATVINPSNGGWIFNNYAVVDIQSGVLSAQSQLNLNAGGAFSGAGKTRVDGGTATMNGNNNIVAGGTFELASGNYNGTGIFTGSGGFVWSGGTISGANGVNANLFISGGDKTLTGIFTNAGTAIWTGNGVINCSANSIFENSGSFKAENAAQFYNYTGSSPVPRFRNSGTFIKNGVTGATLFSVANSGVAFDNTGVVSAETGPILLSGGGASSNGTFAASADASVEFSGGTHSFHGGLNFSGAGVSRLNGATITLMDGTNFIAAGGTLEVAAGTMNGNGIFSGSGTLSWTGGTLAGDMTLANSVTFFISGNSDRSLAGILHSSVTTIWTNNANFFCSAGSVFNNSGTFTAQGDGQFYNNTGGSPAPVFNNTGTFRKNNSTGPTTFSSANSGVGFANFGIADLQSGILAISGGYVFTNSSLLKVSLGGTNATTDFGQEIFPNNAALDGSLVVALVNGFVPTNGMSFDVVKFASRTGQFSATQLPPLPSGSVWKIEYNPGAVTLRVAAPHMISAPRLLSNGHFQMTFTGPSASAAIFRASTNLIDWTPLQTNNPFNGNFLFDDGQAMNYTNRFYQIQIVP